ncbi:hypothetical protein ACXZ9C_10815 [Streptococcus agalactiae]
MRRGQSSVVVAVVVVAVALVSRSSQLVAVAWYVAVVRSSSWLVSSSMACRRK